MDKEDWEEEEHLVVVKLQGVIDNEFLYSCESANCRLLGIDTDEPVLQIGNYTFIGEFKESIGTHVLFQELESSDSEGSKQLKYSCNTTKTLEMSRVFLVKKEKESEQVARKPVTTINQSDWFVSSPILRKYWTGIPSPSTDAQENQQQENIEEE